MYFNRQRPTKRHDVSTRILKHQQASSKFLNLLMPGDHLDNGLGGKSGVAPMPRAAPAKSLTGDSADRGYTQHSGPSAVTHRCAYRLGVYLETQAPNTSRRIISFGIAFSAVFGVPEPNPR